MILDIKSFHSYIRGLLDKIGRPKTDILHPSILILAGPPILCDEKWQIMRHFKADYAVNYAIFWSIMR